MARRKKLSHKSLLGQEGANLIERIVTDMGQVWRPTSVHDTGVDGTIELRDPETAEVSNRHIQVQSKATGGFWESETTERFVFRVHEDDLNYWLRGNLPVILIMSRPSTSEAYWVSINHYFSDPKLRSTRKVEVKKAQDRFCAEALPRLVDLAIPPERGIYKPPLRKEEELVSNLLEVCAIPETLYMAETQFRRHKDLRDWMIAREVGGLREWILRNKRIVTFYDLTEPPWTEIADRGTVEEFSTREWTESDDEDKCREWVALLNECLRARLWGEWVRFQDKTKFRFFYFAPYRGREQRIYSYRSEVKRTRREVVMPIMGKKTKKIICYRHSAMRAQFRRFDDRWYLEMTPTYFYTVDGREPSPHHAAQLAGIKRLEHNEAVLGQLIMWERILTDEGTMFHPEYAWLKFGRLARFEVGQGIADDLWLPVEEGEATDDADTEDLLF